MLQEATLSLWSELCGARVSLTRVPEDQDGDLHRVVLDVDGLELRVTSSLEAERAAMANARLNLAVGAGLGLTVAFALSLAVSRGLVRPIREVRDAARLIGAGDLTPKLATERSDEVGDVVRAFEEMTRDLRVTIRRVAEAADRVDTTATTITEGTTRFHAVNREQQRGNDEAAATLSEIAALVDRLSASAGESAHTLDLAVDGSTQSFRELATSGESLVENASQLSLQTDEISRALEQVAASSIQVVEDTEALLSTAEAAAQNVSEVADAARSLSSNSEQTARLSEEVIETAERGREIVRSAVQGMDATRQTIDESEHVIRALRRRAEEIGTILTVINDVTDETNLLALNAAIIAAQAGENGKAFAVVAGEMKAVCERVGASTREIEGVVRAVQSESASAVESIALGSARAREGAHLIGEAESSLVEITNAARQSSGRMAESADATAQQMVAAAAVAEQMESVREGVGRIRAVTRAHVETNAVVQQSSAALQEVTRRMGSVVDVQTRGTSRIGEIVEAVQHAVHEITEELKQQGAASQQVASVVRRSSELTRSHDASAVEIRDAAEALARQAEALRDAVRPFQI